uniref:Peptidase C1A papain C-terminal domain-containing protein n=1 Tax=Plectus sambesii TaxID=2011161 RepID=A0A914VU79_9BILA
MSSRLLVVVLALLSVLAAIEANTHHRHASAADKNRPQLRFAEERHGGIEEMTRTDSRYLRKPCLRPPKPSARAQLVKSYPRTWEFPGFEASLPQAWDWRNVNGINYAGPSRNQHIPVYCGSCWVFGGVGTLSDRFNVARRNRWPPTFLSPQEIIDCGGRGNCQGGSVTDVFEYAKEKGLVHEDCNVYRATNGKCDDFHRCGSCWPDNCFAIQNYTRYFVKDYGEVMGRENMMSEIFIRGPIACSIGATQKFELNYTGGVYAEKLTLEVSRIG